MVHTSRMKFVRAKVTKPVVVVSYEDSLKRIYLNKLLKSSFADFSILNLLETHLFYLKSGFQ